MSRSTRSLPAAAVAVAAAVVTTLAAAVSPVGATAAASPEAVARDYLAALDRRDAPAVCDSWSDGLLRTVGTTRAACAAAVARDLQVTVAGRRWAGVGTRIGAVRRSGALARVDASARHRFYGAAPERIDDRLWLRRSGGRWRLVKPGASFYTMRFAGALHPPPTVRDAPVGPREALRPFAPRPPAAPCAGTGTRASDRRADVTDPRSDRRVAAPWLDLASATLARDRDGSACLEVETRGRLRPASQLLAELTQSPARRTFRVVSASLRLAGSGERQLDGSPQPASFGWVGPTTLRIGFPAGTFAADSPIRLTLELTSTAPLEPLIARPARGSDRLQARFGAAAPAVSRAASRAGAGARRRS